MRAISKPKHGVSTKVWIVESTGSHNAYIRAVHQSTAQWRTAYPFIRAWTRSGPNRYLGVGMAFQYNPKTGKDDAEYDECALLEATRVEMQP